MAQNSPSQKRHINGSIEQQERTLENHAVGYQMHYLIHQNISMTSEIPYLSNSSSQQVESNPQSVAHKEPQPLTVSSQG